MTVVKPTLQGFLLSIALTSSVFAEELALDTAELRAQLSPARYAVLSAEMSGKIERLPVFEGMRVNAGDSLLSFDCSIQQAQLQKAATELDVARNNLKGAARMAELNAIGSVELVNAQLEERKALADIAYLRALINRCVITAPYDGSIGDLNARAQEFVQAGEPLIEILDDTQLQLEFIIPSTWVSWLNPGFAFEVFLEDTNQAYPAKLMRLAAKVDAMSQSIKAVALIDGTYTELLPGMSGRIRISRSSIEQ